MIIKNGTVFTGNGFEHKDLFVDGGVFVSDVDSRRAILDATDLYVIPGLTDIHFHGCMGQDFSNGTLEALETIAKYEASQGITTICPATVTLPSEQILKACKTAAQYHRLQADSDLPDSNSVGALLCGIHLEGPFLSEEKKGAQNPSYLMRADANAFHAWQEAAEGLVKIISVAPEYPENMEFIRNTSSDVCISLAHSFASYETAMEACRAGAKHVTHLFNGMSPLAHRDPGIPGAAYDTKDVEIELICDGVHIHPAMIRAIFSMYGADRIIFISDSLESTGMPDGTYSLGGQTLTVSGNLATIIDPITGTETIAGSCQNLMDCVRYAVREVGLPLEVAIQCAASNPAKSIGIYDTYGSLDVGKVANFVLLDKELNVVGVYIKGERI